MISTSHRVLPLLLVLAAIITYANSTAGVFIHDDLPSIVANDDVRSVVHASMWGTWSSAPHSSIDARPLVRLSLAINYAWSGLDVFSYHIVNIAIHIFCGLLLYYLLGLSLVEMQGRVGVAFLAALLWLVHPLNSECVNYIVVRTESLMALCYLATLYSSARRWNTTAVICCVLGMLCKESMVTAPIAVLLYDRAFTEPSLIGALRRRPGLYAGLAAAWVPLFVLVGQGGRGDSAGFTGEMDVWQYALNQCEVIVGYLGKIFWPHPLNIDYGYARVLSLGDVWAEASLLLALFAVSVWVWRRSLPLGFACVFFFLTLAPTSSIVPILTEVGAERRMYLPLMALLPLGVALSARVFARCKSGWRWGVVMALVVALALAGVTVRRNGDYGDDASLWASAVLAAPDNVRARNNLALALESRDQLEAALLHYRRALELQGGWAEPHNNMGGVLLRLGRAQEAVSHLRQALELRPHYLAAQYNLGVALLRVGRPKQAGDYLQKVLRVQPNFFAARLQAGRARATLGDYTPALVHLRRALELRPAAMVARQALADVLLASGQVDEAIQHYEMMLAIEPGRADLKNALAAARRQQEE